MPHKSLIDNPLYKAEDLGKVLPQTTHAISVCLPRWEDVVGYEERDPAVLDELKGGYPRFVYHPLVSEAFELFKHDDSLECQVYSSMTAAERCKDYLLSRMEGANVYCSYFEDYHAAVVYFPLFLTDDAKAYWQHTGEGISSRFAEAIINGTTIPDAEYERKQLKERIAEYLDVDSSCVYLFPGGMSAINAVHQVCLELRPGLESVQFAFPYSDTLKLQEKFGEGVTFYPSGDETDLADLKLHLDETEISALFCEFPTNPLLTCVDIKAISVLAEKYHFPFIVDDTIGGYTNVDLLPHVDLLVTSLTKFFSGTGDVMGGAVVVNPESEFSKEFLEKLNEICVDDSYCGLDVIRIEEASRDYPERMEKINKTAEELCDYLVEHEMVDYVYYPKASGKEIYDSLKKESGGYGGVLSFVLKDASRVTRPFYNELKISKGPNLGTYFSLCCPFTILAHYHELEFAESAGASRYLIRISVGLEDISDLKTRFDHAFDTISEIMGNQPDLI